ncbi:MAG: L-threonylcarbamoyladenylate synthase [Xanthomonadales bacterium]|nr:L-threonylcarbamoyladenylate synthase [Xanthomonadales bacterium]
MPASRIVDPTAANINVAADMLRRGELVAFSTETVYGLGADALSAAAVGRIFAAKGRPANHPLIVHISDASELTHWATDVPNGAIKLAEAFWPGPLTMILRRGRNVLDELTGAQATIGLRIPAHPVALKLLRRFGSGIAAPSANRFGQVSPTTAAHVAEGLGDRVGLILDGGPCAIGIESSIVDLTGTLPRLLRPGMLSRAAIEEVLGTALDRDNSSAPRVSGSLESHYAPRTPVRWLSADAILKALKHEAGRLATGVIALEDQPVDAMAAAQWRNLSADPDAYAHELYAQLRELDALKLDLILLEIPPDTAEWEAVRDRLQRAAGGHNAGKP